MSIISAGIVRPSMVTSAIRRAETRPSCSASSSAMESRCTLLPHRLCGTRRTAGSRRARPGPRGSAVEHLHERTGRHRAVDAELTRIADTDGRRHDHLSASRLDDHVGDGAERSGSTSASPRRPSRGRRARSAGGRRDRSPALSWRAMPRARRKDTRLELAREIAVASASGRSQRTPVTGRPLTLTGQPPPAGASCAGRPRSGPIRRAGCARTGRSPAPASCFAKLGRVADQHDRQPIGVQILRGDALDVVRR